MISLQHQAVSRVTSESWKKVPPSCSRTKGLERVQGTKSTTPHSTNRREATWVAAGAGVAGGGGQEGEAGRERHSAAQPCRHALDDQLINHVLSGPVHNYTAEALPCQRTCDKDGRANQAQSAVHHLQHRRRLRQLEGHLHRLHAQQPRVFSIQLASVHTHGALLQRKRAWVAPARRPEARWRPHGLPLFPWWSCMSDTGRSSCKRRARRV